MFRKNEKKIKEIKLTVLDLNSSGFVRIDRNAMKKLGINRGGFVEIEGRRKTVAIAYESKEKGSIQMNVIIRKNAMVNVGDRVIVRKADVRAANIVRLAPTSMTLTVDENFIAYIKKRLINHPLVTGDIANIPVRTLYTIHRTFCRTR